MTQKETKFIPMSSKFWQKATLNSAKSTLSVKITFIFQNRRAKRNGNFGLPIKMSWLRCSKTATKIARLRQLKRCSWEWTTNKAKLMMKILPNLKFLLESLSASRVKRKNNYLRSLLKNWLKFDSDKQLKDTNESGSQFFHNFQG